MNFRSTSEQAKKAWLSLPEKTRLMILNNCWCPRCVKATTIADDFYLIERCDQHIVLKGLCRVCSHEIARLVEGCVVVEPKEWVIQQYNIELNLYENVTPKEKLLTESEMRAALKEFEARYPNFEFRGHNWASCHKHKADQYKPSL